MAENVEELILKYGEELKRDCTVNPLNLTDVCYNMSLNRQKWFDRCNQCKRLIRKADEALVQKINDGGLKMELTRKKRGETTGPLDIKSEDGEIKELQKKLNGLKYLLEFCEGASKIIDSMQWDLRNIIKNNELNQT